MSLEYMQQEQKLNVWLMQAKDLVLERTKGTGKKFSKGFVKLHQIKTTCNNIIRDSSQNVALSEWQTSAGREVHQPHDCFKFPEL